MLLVSDLSCIIPVGYNVFIWWNREVFFSRAELITEMSTIKWIASVFTVNFGVQIFVLHLKALIALWVSSASVFSLLAFLFGSANLYCLLSIICKYGPHSIFNISCSFQCDTSQFVFMKCSSGRITNDRLLYIKVLQFRLNFQLVVISIDLKLIWAASLKSCLLEALIKCLTRTVICS